MHPGSQPDYQCPALAEKQRKPLTYELKKVRQQRAAQALIAAKARKRQRFGGAVAAFCMQTGKAVSTNTLGRLRRQLASCSGFADTVPPGDMSSWKSAAPPKSVTGMSIHVGSSQPARA